MNLGLEGTLIPRNVLNEEKVDDLDEKVNHLPIDSSSSSLLKKTTYNKASTSCIPPVIYCEINDETCEEEYKENDYEEQVDLRYFLTLLESESHEENRNGMFLLMQQVNTDLVESKRNESIAQILLLPDEVDRTKGKSHVYKLVTASRLRFAFLRFLALESLRLSALRVLVSSLQLVEITNESDKIELSSHFWKHVLGIVSKNIQNREISVLEASFTIKCLRLLHDMDPERIEPYVRYSLLPYILHIVQKMGPRNRFLMQQCKSLLSPLGVSVDTDELAL